MLEHRPVRDADDVGVGRGVVELAERKAVGNHRPIVIGAILALDGRSCVDDR
jgi:hypothetical protein